MDAICVKAIFTFQDFTQTLSIPDLSLQVILGDTSKTVSLPYKDALLIEARDLGSQSIVQFQLEDKKGEIIGYAETVIPACVFGGSESEGTQQLQFQLTKGRDLTLTTNVYAIYLGKKLKKTELSKSKQFLHSPSLPKSVGPSQTSSPMNKKASPHTSETNSPASRKSNEAEYTAVNQLIQLNKNIVDIAGLEDTFANRQAHNLSGFHGSSPNSPYNDRSYSGTRALNRSGTTEPGAKPNTLNSFSIEKPASPEKNRPDYALLDKVKRLSESNLDDTHMSLLAESQQVRYQSQQILPGYLTSQGPAEKQIPEIFATLEKNSSGNGILKAQIEYLKSHLMGLEYKITEVDVLQRENSSLKKEIQEGQIARRKADERVMNALSESKQETLKINDQVTSLVSQGTSLTAKNQELNDELLKAKATISKLTLTNTQKDNELSEAKAKNAELSEVGHQLQKAKESLVRVESARSDDQRSFQKSLDDIKGTLDETKNILDKVSQEKRDLAMQVAQEKLGHQETKNELMLTQRRLQNAEAYKEAITSLEIQRDELLRQLAECRAERDEAHKLFEKAQEALNTKLREFQAKELEYISRATSFEEEMRGSQSKLSAMTFKLNKAELEVAQLNARIGDLEQAALSYGDAEGQIAVLKKKLASAIEDKNLISKGVEGITANYKAITQRALLLEKKNEDLGKILQLRDQEINELRDIVTEFENMEVPDTAPKYIATKDDLVDAALAHFLNRNKNGSKYRFMFSREAEGVYQFGSKKIYIKIENDKILIRVGGGYMTLDELLEVVAPAEYEKLIHYSKIGGSGSPGGLEGRKSMIRAAGLAKIATNKGPASSDTKPRQSMVALGRGSIKDLNSKTDLRDAVSPKRDSKAQF